MIQVQAASLPQGDWQYLFEDNQVNKNTIFIPDITQNVTSCLQTMLFNGLTNSYALDLNSAPAQSYDIDSLARCLSDFIQQQQITNYQIVAAGSAIWVVEQAILQQDIKPIKILALDPDFAAPIVHNEVFPDYETMVLAKKQVTTKATDKLQIAEFQQQMILNAQVANFHEVDDQYELIVSQQRQKEFSASIPERSFKAVPMAAELLMTEATQQKVLSKKLKPQQNNSYTSFDCYVIERVFHEMFWYAPMTILDFI